MVWKCHHLINIFSLNYLFFDCLFTKQSNFGKFGPTCWIFGLSFLTKGVRIHFTSSSISIHAIRIRSSPYINPLELSSCSDTQLYNTKVGYCVRNSCTRTSCGEFPVKYGKAVCTGHEDGDSCSIECHIGYMSNTYNHIKSRKQKYNNYSLLK